MNAPSAQFVKDQEPQVIKIMLGTEEPEASEEAEPDEVGNLISQMNEKLSLLDGGAPHELEQRLKTGH